MDHAACESHRLTLDVGAPPSLDSAEIAQIWCQQRDRLIAALRDLDGADWRAASRCRSWSVADVVAHLADGARRMIGCLDPANRDPDGFRDVDPRVTPAEWILGTERSPSFLIDDYHWSTDALFGLVDQLSDEQPHLDVWAPYRRRVPWQLFVVHGLFDHWMHERDVLLPLHRMSDAGGCRLDSRIAVTYAVLVATLVAAFDQRPAVAHLHLSGVSGGCVQADGPGGRVTMSPVAGCSEDPDLIGEAERAADALTGRTTTVADTLSGDRSLVGDLSLLADWFRDGP